MKYNVGDKVVNTRDLSMLFNPYYKGAARARLIQTVTEADDQLFSVNDNRGNYCSTIAHAKSAGSNQYLARFQSSGMCYSGCSRDKLLHLEKDRDEIKRLVETAGNKQFQEDHKTYFERATYYQAMLKRTEDMYDEDMAVNFELLGLGSFRGFGV